ncbi:DUF2712 domain-containing protein [Siminovitchia sp. FSL H7-0308]|uniref:DUF2712 domain-containing protein n=1 Tax=Siminovitchia thermophila TaxID=1245522 RepID=A0ABS2RGB7_9BACI|nr:DUF2712 domain-containing protein [Siminovitchia thermophila]MBM7717631.1 hypothetical protein [Siminovitchia thermophila]ONK24105.1 DUF2712 domain-containing protein [Bacillus sp. VT-16-64]
MRKKLIVPIVAALCFTVGVGINTSDVEAAGNYKDKKFSFTLKPIKRNSYSKAREKRDATSAYVKLNSIGKGKMKAWIVKSNGASVRAKKVTVKQGQAKFITNYAYEDYGKVNVKLAGETEKAQIVKVAASGVWSPDSI